MNQRELETVEELLLCRQTLRRLQDPVQMPCCRRLVSRSAVVARVQFYPFCFFCRRVITALQPQTLTGNRTINNLLLAKTDTDVLKYLECPLSLELLDNPVIVSCCKHAFSKSDLDTALQVSNRCPLCRQVVQKTEPCVTITQIVNGLQECKHVGENLELRYDAHFCSYLSSSQFPITLQSLKDRTDFLQDQKAFEELFNIACREREFTIARFLADQFGHSLNDITDGIEALFASRKSQRLLHDLLDANKLDFRSLHFVCIFAERYKCTDLLTKATNIQTKNEKNEVRLKTCKDCKQKTRTHKSRCINCYKQKIHLRY